MGQEDNSNFSVITTTKPSKDSKKGLIIGGIIVLFLAISIPAGVYLVKQQQDIREKAESALVCPATEACPVPGTPDLLRSCYSIAEGGAPREISCSTIANVGTKAYCGSIQYCCPSLGASWTTDLELCASPSPTPTITPTPTATSSASPSVSPTATSSASPSVSPTATLSASSPASASATLAPIPVTGTSWPTVAGIGLGILVIVGSILLVL